MSEVKRVKSFQRGLDKTKTPFKLALKFFTSRVGVGLIENSDFHICVRENYFNIYWKGCSVLKYRPNARIHKYEIHHEYLGVPKPTNDRVYVDLKEEREDLVHESSWSFMSEIIEKAKAGSIPIVEEKGVKGKDSEKANLAQYLKESKPCWLDLEVAFSRRSINEEGKPCTVADRIDLAVIEETEEGAPVLKFVEVKMSGDSRLKREKDKLPEVAEKLEIYKKNLIEDQRENLKNSYMTVAENMLELSLVSENRRELIQQWLIDRKIDDYPYLLIINSNKKPLAEIHRNKIDNWTEEKSYPKPEYIDHSN